MTNTVITVIFSIITQELWGPVQGVSPSYIAHGEEARRSVNPPEGPMLCLSSASTQMSNTKGRLSQCGSSCSGHSKCCS